MAEMSGYPGYPRFGMGPEEDYTSSAENQFHNTGGNRPSFLMRGIGKINPEFELMEDGRWEVSEKAENVEEEADAYEAAYADLREINKIEDFPAYSNESFGHGEAAEYEADSFAESYVEQTVDIPTAARGCNSVDNYETGGFDEEEQEFIVVDEDGECAESNDESEEEYYYGENQDDYVNREEVIDSNEIHAEAIDETSTDKITSNTSGGNDAEDRGVIRFNWWSTNLRSSNAEGDALPNAAATLAKSQSASELQDILLAHIVDAIAQDKKSEAISLVEAFKVVANKYCASPAPPVEESKPYVPESKPGKKKSKNKKTSSSVKQIKASISSLAKMLEKNAFDSNPGGSSSSLGLPTPNDIGLDATLSSTFNAASETSLHDRSGNTSGSTLSSSSVELHQLGDDERQTLLAKQREMELSIAELKDLVNAQSTHLKCTLETLENIDKERIEGLESIEILQKAIEARDSFITELQTTLVVANETNAALETSIVTMKKELDSTNTELVSLKNIIVTSECKSEDQLNVLVTENEQLKSENSQLEIDIVEMIECCKDYRKTLKRMQEKRRHRVRLGYTAGTLVTIPPTEGYKYNKGVQAVAPISNNGNTQTMARQLEHLADEREQLEELLYLASQEHDLMKAEIKALNASLGGREEKIGQLEFMLRCEIANNRRNNDSAPSSPRPILKREGRTTPKKSVSFADSTVDIDDDNITKKVDVDICEKTSRETITSTDASSMESIPHVKQFWSSVFSGFIQK